MKKEILNQALYCIVEATFKDNKRYTGWLVPYNKKYAILPLDDAWNIYTAPASEFYYLIHKTNGKMLS